VVYVNFEVQVLMRIALNARFSKMILGGGHKFYCKLFQSNVYALEVVNDLNEHSILDYEKISIIADITIYVNNN
jgi:hypothetical protein